MILGKTGPEVFWRGIGSIPLNCSTGDKAIRVVQHTPDLGINFIDTGRSYISSKAAGGLVSLTRERDVGFSAQTSRLPIKRIWRARFSAGLMQIIEKLQTMRRENERLVRIGRKAFNTLFGKFG